MSSSTGIPLLNNMPLITWNSEKRLKDYYSTMNLRIPYKEVSTREST